MPRKHGLSLIAHVRQTKDINIDAFLSNDIENRKVHIHKNN